MYFRMRQKLFLLKEMKHNIGAVITSVLALVCLSCESSNGNLPTLLPEDAPAITDLSLLIDSIEKISFSDSLGDVIAPLQKIITLPSGDFLTLDNRKNVFIYSMDGVQKRRIGRTGRGPGEYIALQDIAFNPDSETINLLCLNKVIEYDLLGQHLSSFKLPKYNYDAIVPFNDHFWLFVAAPNHSIEDLKQMHKTVHYYSKERRDVTKTIIPRKDYIINTELISYSASFGYYLRPLEGENILYRIANTRPERTCRVSFGKQQVPKKSLLRNGKYDIGNYIMSSYYKMPMDFQFTSDLFAFEAIGPEGVLSYYLYKNDLTPIGFWREPKDCLSPVKIVSSDSRFIYFLINEPQYWRNKDINSVDPLMKMIISNFTLEEDCPILFKVHFKSI